MTRLLGKVAMVSGGSRGIGRAIAERLGHDGADVVAFLASDDARWVNGQTIQVNGGIL